MKAILLGPVSAGGGQITLDLQQTGAQVTGNRIPVVDSGPGGAASSPPGAGPARSVLLDRKDSLTTNCATAILTNTRVNPASLLIS